MGETVTFFFSLFKNPGSYLIQGEFCFRKVKLVVVSRLDLGREMEDGTIYLSLARMDTKDSDCIPKGNRSD